MKALFARIQICLLAAVLFHSLTSSSQPIITTQPTNQIVYGGSNVIFSVAVSGTGPFTYQWMCNGTNLPNAIITTVAGNGNSGYNGDGGLADLSSISSPEAVAIDKAGNLLIAEYNSRVRKVDTNGIITTVVGNGTNGFSGDVGFATNASVSIPSGLALDAAGNLYIADYNNNNIRKLDTNGIITTVVGNGVGTFAGDGGAATNASLFNPVGLAFDGLGNLYIADSGNNVIRKVDSSGIISTLPVGGLVNPTGVALDSSGDLYVAACNNNQVLKMDTNNVVTVFAGTGSYIVAGDGGLAVNAGTSYPRGVAVDASGNVYIAAFYDNRVRVVDTNGLINTVAGNGNSGFSGDNGGALDANFQNLVAIALDNQVNIYVADFFNFRIRATTYPGPTLKFSNVTTNLSGPYSVVISNASGSVTSTVAALTVVLPPSISAQPKSQQILVASNVTFNTSAYGTSPLNYQWQFNGTNINGATNNTFMIGVVTTNDAGNYSATITNNYGSITSSVATLTVVVIPPGIASQPANQTVPTGSNATFDVVASGSPLINYQWYFNSVLLYGETNANLSLFNVTTNQAGPYCVSVTSPYGSVTSHIATLTVGWLPSITMQPTNQVVQVGTRALITASVSGLGPLTFQWQLNGTNLPNDLISTVAGTGASGYAGDGGSATDASIYQPNGLAADNAGNYYIADSSNNRIRSVDTNGIITTVAGISVPGFAGDGGAATNARLSHPNGVTLDGGGNLFIADSSNNRIRKVDTNGIITTVAGGGGTFGDGGPATNCSLSGPYAVAVDTIGNLFIADTFNNRIRQVGTNGIILTVAGGGGTFGDGGMATNAKLKNPQGVTLDGAGNLLIADFNNNRVRKVDANGVITTLVGNGSITYSGDNGPATNAGINPFGLGVDGHGDLLIADEHNNRIRQVDPYGVITTVAGTNTILHGFGGDGSSATNALLSNTSAVAMDIYGRVLLADTFNNRIRRFRQGPVLVLDSLTPANAGNYTVVVNSSFGSITSSVAVLTVLTPPSIVVPPANQTAGLGSNATFSVVAAGTLPLAFQWQSNGTNLSNQTGPALNLTAVQWTDAGGYRVVITNNYGSLTSAMATLTVGTPPVITGQPTNQVILAGSNGLLNVTVSGDGPFSYQWLLNGTNLPPIITTVAGTNRFGYSGDGAAATNATLNSPHGLAVDAAGNLLIADYNNNCIRMVDTNGIITTVAGTGTSGNSGNGGPATGATLNEPAGLGFDAHGGLYIAEDGNGDVRKVDTNGVISRVAGTGSLGVANDGAQATNTALYHVTGVAIDSNGNMYLNEQAHCRIRKVGTNGILTTAAGNTSFATGGFSGDGGPATNAQLNIPYGIALDSSGKLFIADNGNGRVREVGTNGIITTVAGTGTAGNSGIGGPATNANVWPFGLAIASSGDLFISDGERVIRQVDTNGIITSVAGHFPPGAFNDGGPATNSTLVYNWGLAFDRTGNLYIADANRIRMVHFAGDATLQIPSAGLTNSGNYTVLVTTPFGSVVSEVAALTVLISPQQFTGHFAGVGLQLQLSGTPNYPYTLQSTTNLTPPVNWQPVLTNPADGNGNWQFTDTNLGGGQKFYRALGR